MRKKDPTNAARQARHRAKTKVKTTKLQELLKLVKELIMEIEGKEDDR